MSNDINKKITVKDLVSPFRYLYEKYKEEYENKVQMCITYEAWNEYLSSCFGEGLQGWLSSLAIAANEEEKIMYGSNGNGEDGDGEDGDGTVPPNSQTGNDIEFDFVEDSEIIYGTTSGSSFTLNEYGTYRNLAPACIPSFWKNGDRTYGENIIKLIAAFNDGDKERRIFNEVHCYKGDVNLTLGFGHFASENVNSFFIEMKKDANDIWETMKSYIFECIINNKSIYTGRKNTNIHKTYKEQFWTDFNSLFDPIKSENKTENEILKEAINVFFTSNKLNVFAKKVYKNFVNTLSRIISKKDTKDLDSIWGVNNEWDIAKLIARFAMKDAYVKKALYFYKCLEALKVNNNEEVNNNEIINPEVKFANESIEIDNSNYKNLSEVYNKLLSITKTEIDNDNKTTEKTINELLAAFDIGIEKFNKDMRSYQKEISKEINSLSNKLNIHIEDFHIVGNSENAVSIKSFSQMNGTVEKTDSGSTIIDKAPVLEPFPGIIDYNGYWFYDIMKDALRLRPVCFYQILFWMKHTLDCEGEETNAAAAAKSSWKSSRFAISDTDSYLKYNGGKISISNSNNYSKALMYWHNYNVKRARDEKKKEIRGRQKKIWTIWFEGHYDKQPNLDFSSTPKPILELEKNTMVDEKKELTAFIKGKEPRLNKY